MQQILKWQDRQVNYEVEYRQRRSLSIIVENDGTVRVLAPKRMRLTSIKDVVEKNAGWICSQLDIIEERRNLFVPRSYRSGEPYLYLGQLYDAIVEVDERLPRPLVGLDKGSLRITVPVSSPEIVKNALITWYRQETMRLASGKVEHFQPYIKSKPASIHIKNQQRRWGSCSQKGNLNFNWRCILLPEPILDYMIVHEMCHLEHLNHSREYWDLVGSIIPDYKSRRKWLKDNSVALFQHMDYVISRFVGEEYV